MEEKDFLFQLECNAILSAEPIICFLAFHSAVQTQFSFQNHWHASEVRGKESLERKFALSQVSNPQAPDQGHV